MRTVLGACNDLSGSHSYFPVPVSFCDFLLSTVGQWVYVEYWLPTTASPPSSSGGVTSALLPASAVVSASPDPLSCEGR